VSIVLECLNNHIETVKQVEALQPAILAVADQIIDSLQNGGKVILMGNGGSAGDAQHIAAELVGRYKKDRKAFCALAITTDPSIVTAIGNDFGAHRVFSRQVEAHGRPGDIVIGISTSGNSENVVEAIKTARDIGCTTYGFLGNDGGKLRDLVDIPIVVESRDTPRVQECHILIGHIICDLVERGMTEDAA
jgi:D-sedoheptulose 7-phosphate isomerase